MTDEVMLLLFIKDFSGRGGDRYFIWQKDNLREAFAEDLAKSQLRIICHDYWLIAPAIYRQAGALPKEVVDLAEFECGISGKKVDRRVRERRDIKHMLTKVGDEAAVGSYIESFYQGADPGEPVMASIAQGLIAYWMELLDLASKVGELERAISVEVPVFNVISLAAVQGICIDVEKLRQYKSSTDNRYYMALKRFAESHAFPYEVPREADVVEHLAKEGYDLDGVSLDYILKFVPAANGFAEDLIELRRAHAARLIISRMAIGGGRVFPIPDTQATVTSRIYYRDPPLQGLPKAYRDVFLPDRGYVFSYVDYDQFEVGVMGGLSRDEKILNLYASGDLYLEVARDLFNDDEKRGSAKRLFLSYAYGMKRSALLDAAVALGSDRSEAKKFFSSFDKYEGWKSAVNAEFEEKGRVGTSLGNYKVRAGDGPLSPKERRSSVSQVVQGTASLIFKKAILAVSAIPGVAIRIPMHDALLVQHVPGFDSADIIDVFSRVMTDHFQGGITGKASLESFHKVVV